MPSPRTRPAVFFDRDNTLIEDPGYLKDPAHVKLVAGAAEATARLRRAGFAAVVVTNQSGVARGLMAESDVAAVNARMKELLAAGGGGLDGVYYCPYLNGPEAVRQEYRRDSELRKPLPGMLKLAAEELGLDLSRSWMIGDSSRDIEAGRAAGCRTIFIGPGGQAARADAVATNLTAAADRILAGHKPELVPDAVPPPPTDAPIAAPTNPPAMILAESPTLHAMLEELRMIRREGLYDDFSIGRLAGSIAQAFAVVAIGAGLYAWTNADGNTATIRLLAGIAFQIMALTWFSASKRK
jgi:D-glycero-D-manno-heptose 1,7-bisphosphate phosphatase